MAAAFFLCLRLFVGCLSLSVAFAEETGSNGGASGLGAGNITAIRAGLLAVIIVELIVVLVLLAYIITKDRKPRQRADSINKYDFHETETNQEFTCQTRVLDVSRQVSFDLHHANKTLVEGSGEELYANESLSLPDDDSIQDEDTNGEVVDIEGISELEEESSDHWVHDEEEEEEEEVGEEEMKKEQEDVPEIVYTNAVSEEYLYIEEEEDENKDGPQDEISDTSMDTQIFVGNGEPYEKADEDDDIQDLSSARADYVTPSEEDQCDAVDTCTDEIVGFEELLEETSDGLSETGEFEEDDVIVEMTDGNVLDESVLESDDSEDLEMDSDNLPLDVNIDTDTDVNSDTHSLTDDSVDSQERDDKTNELEFHRESLYESYISSIANDLSSYNEIPLNQKVPNPKVLHKPPKEKRKTIPSDFML